MPMFLEIVVLKCQNLRKLQSTAKKMQKFDEHSKGFLKNYSYLIFNFYFSPIHHWRTSIQ
jgi:hypothetical protein